MQSLLQSIFSINSIWFFVMQAVVWLGICLVIIMSMDNARPERGYGKLKSNLGFFMMFVALTGGLFYIVFGRVPLG